MTTGHALALVVAFNVFGASVLLAAGMAKQEAHGPIQDLVLTWLRNPIVVASSIGGFAGAIVGTWGAMKASRPPSWLEVPRTGPDILMHLIINWAVTVFIWPLLFPLMFTSPSFEGVIGTAFIAGILAQNLLLRLINNALKRADTYEAKIKEDSDGTRDRNENL